MPVRGRPPRSAGRAARAAARVAQAGGSAAMRASVRRSRSRCSATSSGRGCGQARSSARGRRRRPSSCGVQAVVAAALAHQVDDLVLEDGRQPAAQRRAAGERGAPGDHRFEDVVHQVFGQQRVVQAALGEAHQVARGAGPARAQATAGGGREGGGGGGVAIGACHAWGVPAAWRWHTVARPHLARLLTEDHSQITSASRSRDARREPEPARRPMAHGRPHPRRRRPGRHPRADRAQPAQRRLRGHRGGRRPGRAGQPDRAGAATCWCST